MMLQLVPTNPHDNAQGKGKQCSWSIISEEHDLKWVVAQDETGKYMLGRIKTFALSPNLYNG